MERLVFYTFCAIEILLEFNGDMQNFNNFLTHHAFIQLVITIVTPKFVESHKVETFVFLLHRLSFDLIQALQP